jgi:hypothetical protein
MSVPFWDIRGDAAMAGDRDRVVVELKRRDSARNRARESPTERARPTFVVRSSTNGDKLSSWADGTARHVPITTNKDRSLSLPNGVKARSLEALLVQIGYIDDVDDVDDNVEIEQFQYVPVDHDQTTELLRERPSSVYHSPPISGRPQWQIDRNDLTLEAEPVAAGTFGKVFRGRLAPTGELVAVKVCHEAKAEFAAKAQADFLNELAILRSLSEHDNVVRFFGAVLDDASGAPTQLVLQFCRGGSLLAAIQSRTWNSWRTTTKVRLLAGVARGLEHLHACGVVHRDLAARNVLVEEAASGEWLPRVTDFGMARAVSDAEVGAQTVNTIGPFAWMAPEQLFKLQYSAASDAFAFGVVAFELFARTAPWKGMSRGDVSNRVIAGERLSFNGCGFPAQLEKVVVQHCWAEEPADRPTMNLVRQHFESCTD